MGGQGRTCDLDTVCLRMATSGHAAAAPAHVAPDSARHRLTLTGAVSVNEVVRSWAPPGIAGVPLRSALGSLWLIVPLAAVALVGHFALGAALQGTLTFFFIAVVAVLGFGLFSGNSGILSFGHVGFMALAAYLSAALTIPPETMKSVLPKLPTALHALHMDVWWATPIAALAVGAIAFVIGLPIARMAGIAASIGTFAFLVITNAVIIGADDYTRGPRALYGLPREVDVLTAFVWAALAIVAARTYRDTRFGLMLRASREDELAASSVGVDIGRQRLIAWVLSAAIAAVSGALLAHYLGVISPHGFYFQLTFQLLAMLIVGGMTTTSGAVVGTVLITLVVEVLRRLEEGFTLGPVEVEQVFGLTTAGLSVAILLVMYRRREGILGYIELDEHIARWRAKVMPLPVSVAAVTVPRPHEGTLEVKAVSKAFGGLLAVDAVSLALRPGEIVGLIGPNGSGKTTLLNLIAGALIPTSGHIVLDGRDITDSHARDIAHLGIGRTFQSIRLFRNMTVLENVIVAALASRRGRGQGARAAACRGLLQDFGLAEVGGRMAGTLAYGPQRRLEIARALATAPRYLLLDEPGAGMNQVESDDLLVLLEDLRRRYGLGMLVVDHDLRLIMRLCDRVVVLNKGEQIAAGTPDEVQKNPQVIQAYLGDRRTKASHSGSDPEGEHR